MELNNYQADIVGYVGTLLIGLRLFPTICYNIYKRKIINIPNTFLILESLGTLCFFVYAIHYNKYPLLACNFIVIFSILCIVINNNFYSKKN